MVRCRYVLVSCNCGAPNLVLEIDHDLGMSACAYAMTGLWTYVQHSHMAEETGSFPARDRLEVDSYMILVISGPVEACHQRRGGFGRLGKR